MRAQSLTVTVSSCPADRAQNLGKRLDAFEKMRDSAAESYQNITGEVWRLRHGSHASETGKPTAVAINAMDYLCDRQDRKN